MSGSVRLFRYHFGGVELASDIPLIGLRPAGDAQTNAPRIDVVDAGGEAPLEDKLHYAWNGRFRMRLGEAGGEWRVGSPWGTFLFGRDASTVRIFGANGPNGTILKDLFARRLLPRLVKLKGAATYHAASLAKDGRAILVMGASGAGKSTMSVGLATAAGWDILGDDMALVWGDGRETVAPAAADVTMWPQSCEALGLADEDCAPLLGYDGKRAFRPQRVGSLAPLPLAGIVHLNRTECAAPELVRCARPDGFAAALKQIIYFNPNGAAVDERLLAVTRLNAMLTRAPTWRMSYPASFAAFGEVSEKILAALRDVEEAKG